jgi:hypothetical protein
MVLLSVLACVAAQPHGTIVIASQKYAPVARRHAAIWNLPPAVELKYIQRPSEDHAAAVQAASAGLTDLAPELPSKGTHWHDRPDHQHPLAVWRDLGTMSHAGFSRGQPNISFGVAILHRRNNRHVPALPDFGKKQVLRIDPG